jgi:hypothetical protein
MAVTPDEISETLEHVAEVRRTRNRAAVFLSETHVDATAAQVPPVVRSPRSRDDAVVRRGPGERFSETRASFCGLTSVAFGAGDGEDSFDAIRPQRLLGRDRQAQEGRARVTPSRVVRDFRAILDEGRRCSMA